MALSPASGALSQTQLHVLEQIRAMRAAKPAAPVQANAPAQTAASVQANPAPIRPKPATAQPLATTAATASHMPVNRPRGSILNISV